MPQVYADKIWSKLGKKPDTNMRIKIWVGDGSLVHMRIKILQPGSNQDLTVHLVKLLPQMLNHLHHSSF